MADTTESGDNHWLFEIKYARVWIAQEKGPEVSYNTSSPTIDGRQNVLYGSGGWLSPSNGAFEVSAHDPGVGVAFASVYEVGGKRVVREPIFQEGNCAGIQCHEWHSTAVSYNSALANGEDNIENYAEDMLGLWSYSDHKIKVDALPPEALGLTGMPEEGAEITAAPHKLTFHATENLSGVKSISVSIDGSKATVVPDSSCSPGECTSGEYTLNAEDLTEGVHRLTMTAIDNAGNEAPAKQFLFDVRHGSPVSVGPGTVDSTTGQFTLSATDVSLGGAGGVSRTYQSRNLTAGLSGPLGPQWAISLGGGEDLTVLPTGSVVLVAASGGTTTFTLNSKGEFESPKGDENLKIEYRTEEHKYLLKDSMAGTETIFEQPVGTENTSPSYANQFGSEATEMNHPTGVAIDPSGDVWVADYLDDRILKFSQSGALLAQYGSYGSGEGQFLDPREIAINQTTKNVYVVDEGNSRIVELNEKGEFVETFGWGVTNGTAEFQICKSGSYCKAGIAGSSEGEFKEPKGLTIDSSGNLWIAEYGNNRIEEFNSEGKYLTKFSTEGSGEAQFKGPNGIVYDGGHLYIAEVGNNRVQELSTAGKYIYQWGKAGTGGSEFKEPHGIALDPRTGNLYVADTGNDRVQEFTTAGKFIDIFGSAGSGTGQFSEPEGIAVNASGWIYVADYNNDRMEEWARQTWWPTGAKGTLSKSTTYLYEAIEGSEGNTLVVPSEVLSPTPEGVSCGTKPEELKEEKDKGCRALTFKYATETTAKGENESEWGEYKGHLSQVFFHAWNPSTKAMEEKAVAQYSYDKQGRLRAEWDPRISSEDTDCTATEHKCANLKTMYGYDEAEHVTSVTPSGQESWAFIYGTISGDASTGRLLKVTRAPASAALWNGEAVKVKESEGPKLSGTPAVGVRVSVSNGTWSNNPVVYGYQWEDCNTKGEECTPILGATNANYTPASSDVGHRLIAQVTAVNGGGSVVAASAASTTVVSKAGSFTQAVDSGYSLNAVSCIPSTTDCVLSDSAGKALYATNVSSSSEATWKTWSGPSGQSPSQAVDCPSSSLCLLADGKETAGGELYYATSLGGSFTNAEEPSYGVDAISCVSSSFCVEGQDGLGYFRYSTSPASTSWTLEDQGAAAMKGVFCLSVSFCAIADSKGSVHVATSESQVKSSSWKETNVDGSSALNGVACTATTSCVAVDGSGNALKLTINSEGVATASKHDIDGTTSLTAVTCTGSSTCVAVDTSGNVFVSKNSGETWTKEYTLADKLTSVSCASTSLCATTDTTGNVTAFNPVGGTGTEGESHAPQPGSTIEYRVPLSGPEGSDLPNLTKEEVEKWGQKDISEYEDNDPVEGMAVFPPDEPQGWPASDYKRATIDYFNGKGLTVNTAAPTGGIATTEYNALNEAVRTLSADNRAAAMKEGCKSVSKKECLSAEVSEKLDTKTEYNPEGSDILKVLGPEHKVKLSTGEEVEARLVTHDYYDEGSEKAEEKFKESYSLLTKTTSGALLSNGEEKDVRTTVTSYSGQEDLGWKLRKPTSTTFEPATLDQVRKTVYEEHENAKKEMESTGNVIETRAPAGNSEHVSPPSYSLHFGGAGSGNGQFKEPAAVALDSSGNVWALDTGNDRVEKFSATGSFDAAYGKEGTGNLQFKEPKGIAVNQTTGNVYVTDTGNNRVEELSSSGAFVEMIGWGVSDGKSELEVCKTACKAGLSGTGNGELSAPAGITTDSEDDIWVVDSGNDRVQVFAESGSYLERFGSKGSGNGQLTEPSGIVISEGSVYVVDRGNDRVEQFSTTGSYAGQFGSKGSASGQFEKPYGIAANQSTGVLYVCDDGNQRMQEFSPAGKFLTEWGTWGSTHEQSYPRNVAVGSIGDLYIIDGSAAEVGEWIPPEAGGAQLSFSTQFGSKGTGNGQLTEPGGAGIDGKGNVWIVDYGNNRIEKFGPDGSFLASYGKEGSGEVQFKLPTRLAINKSTGNVYVTDMGNNRVEELSSTGTYVASFGTSGSGTLKEPVGDAIDSSGNVWVADRGNDRIVEFSSTGTYIAAYGKEGSGELQFNKPDGIAFSGENLYVTDSANHRVQELTNKGAYVRAWGLEGNGSGEFWTPEGIAVDAAGNLYVSDENADHVEEFSPAGVFKASFGSPGSGEGQFTKPIGEAMDSAGDLYVVDNGNDRVERWDNNTQAAHDVKTVYYSAKEESSIAACRNHPEWANLPCQIEPAVQPDHGLPELPITTIASYNMWDDTEVTEEKFGTGTKTVVRKKTQTYDPAGRAVTSEETAQNEKKEAVDTTLPKVTVEYNTSTGALEKQSTSEGTITSEDNTLGQLIEYTDASGNVAKYTYEEGGDDRLEEVSEGKGKEAESSQTFSYNTTTGFMEKLVDTGSGMSSIQGTFTASYDVEGEMASETYPNAMTATTTRNSVGQATSVVYEKTNDCASKCPETWFSDSVVPSIHGETLQQTSTLSTENYAYENAGRLLETQETPTGKGCVVRLYGYDEEGNRTSETKREPGTEGKCATSGGSVERHTYDEANRLTDENTAYETFGNMTKMPAGDAGGNAILSTYYVDNQIASEEQKKQLLDYKYDPAGRTDETASENKETKAKANVISHYAGSGNALTWTCEEEDKKECAEGKGKWTRNIPGIDGALDAIQTSSGSPMLQLHDLQGNIVGTVEDSETVTKLASTYNSTEFGVPQSGTTPPKYAWLGAAGVSTETSLGSGTSTEGGASYVPQVARDLQTAPIVPPGAFPNGTGGGSPYTATVSSASLASAQGQAEKVWQEEEAARQKAREREALKALEASTYPEVDPEGILTGKEALHWAELLRQEAWLIEGQLIAGGCMHDSACEADLETDAELLGKASEKLEACYNAVHNGRWVNGVYQTGVCYYDWRYNGEWGHTIVKEFTTEACWSRPEVTGDTQAWYCKNHGGWEFT